MSLQIMLFPILITKGSLRKAVGSLLTFCNSDSETVLKSSFFMAHNFCMYMIW